MHRKAHRGLAAAESRLAKDQRLEDISLPEFRFTPQSQRVGCHLKSVATFCGKINFESERERHICEQVGTTRPYLAASHRSHL